MSNDIAQLKAAEKEEVRPREHRAGDSGLVPGLVLILVGGLVLVMNLTGTRLENWWALFLLIPALSSFAHAWQRYQRHGQLTRSTRNSITGGLLFTLVAAVFLLGLNWSTIWPLFLILFGVKALADNL
jgi:riboflavin transporter FmnP